MKRATVFYRNREGFDCSAVVEAPTLDALSEKATAHVKQNGGDLRECRTEMLREVTTAMPEQFKTTTCRSCGERVIWVILPSGKKCPVDAQPYTKLTMGIDRIPVYSLEEWADGVRADSLDKSALLDTSEFYVSHFATCPDANKHSKKP